MNNEIPYEVLESLVIACVTLALNDYNRYSKVNDVLGMQSIERFFNTGWISEFNPFSEDETIAWLKQMSQGKRHINLMCKG